MPSSLLNKLSFILCAVFALTVFSLPASAFETTAKQAIIVDHETGQVLFEKNADKQMPTSSMSKVMTMYVVFDAIKNGALDLDDRLPVSKKAWAKGGSKMFVGEGSRVNVEKLVRGVIVQSGNDATIVLAEGVAKTEDNFAERMNEKAKTLGMTSSNFKNASGWPDPDHYSTARDLATLASAITRDFPEHYPYYAEKEFTYNDITQANRNPLLYKRINVDGIKTGHTEVGGYGLIGSGVAPDGRRVVIVLNGMASEKERASESARVMKWGYNNFENKTLYTRGQALDVASVSMGKEEHVSIGLADDIEMIVSKAEADKPTVKLEYNEPIPAPIKVGQVIGSVTVTAGYTSKTSDIVALEPVAEAGFFSKIIKKTKLLIDEAL